MTGAGRHQAAIIDAVVSHVRHIGDDPVVERLIRCVETVDVCAAPRSGPSPHRAELSQGVSNIRAAADDSLAAIGRAIADAGPYLEWVVDDGLYYLPGAQVSESYRLGNMNTTLATGDDVIMGLFFLRPDVDYLDHRHAAPEFYLNLTGPSRWRFDFGPWHELAAGSMLWNEPGQVHAVRTGPAPWLSFWAWLSDIDQPCEVVTEPQ